MKKKSIFWISRLEYPLKKYDTNVYAQKRDRINYASNDAKRALHVPPTTLRAPFKYSLLILYYTYLARLFAR